MAPDSPQQPITLHLPPELAAVLAAAATMALAESDTVPQQIAVVITAAVQALYPTATAIHITKATPNTRLRYRKAAPNPSWTMQGRIAAMQKLR